MNTDTLAREVEKVNPDIVIIHQGMYSGEMRLPIKLVQDHSKLKIITISLENNLVEVYNKHTICIKEVSDLLSIIEEDADPYERGGETKPETNFMNQSVPVKYAGSISKGKLEEIQNAHS